MNLDSLIGKKVGKYTILERLGEGGSGVTYKALDTIGGHVAVKFIKSDDGDDWKKEAEKAEKVRTIPQIAYVIEVDEADVEIDGKTEHVKFIVWEFVEGRELHDVLTKDDHVEIPFIVNLAEEIALGIRGMQAADLEHGDLHERNIILIPPQEWELEQKYRIKIVDFGLSRSLRKEFTNDMDYLKRILQLCWKANQYYAGEKVSSDRKFQTLLTDLINRMCDSNLERKLTDPIDLIERIHSIHEQSMDQSVVRSMTLQHPFEYLSVEEMPDSSDLVPFLYSDDVPWLKQVTIFGTTLISGPRGSGKSMMLKNMRLLTQLRSESFDTDNLKDLSYLGFYVNCQHNLYFPFAGMGIQFDNPTNEMFVHYLNLLFVSEILETLIVLEQLKLLTISSITKNKIADFLSDHIFQSSKKVRYLSQKYILDQCKSTVEKEILFTQKKIIKREDIEKRTAVSFLKNFLDHLDSLLPLFNTRQIYFLLDDYSHPKVPYELQKAINRIIGFRNERFCFKVTTEKFGFIPEDLDGKILQQDREYSYLDLGSQYIKAKKPERRYFIKKIIEKRLERAKIDKSVDQFFGLKTFKEGIATALLKDRNIGEDEQESRFKYSGFKMIYRLCLGDVSTILQLCKEIYNTAKSKGISIDDGIRSDLQDKVIRDFSQNRLNMIKEIPDVGNQLYNLVVTFTNISKKYLYEYEIAKKESKFLEVLRFELLENIDCLSSDASNLYKKLITEHIFVDGGLSYPWGQGVGNVKLILRPIYTPALKISYSNRYSVKTDCSGFENFLLNPKVFEKTGTSFLKKLSGKQETLFPEKFDIVLSEDADDDDDE